MEIVKIKMKNINKHHSSIVDSNDIGDNTIISAFVHICSGSKIGKNCEIYDHVLIEKDTVIEDNVSIQAGTKIRENVIIESNVYIGNNVSFSIDFEKRKNLNNKEIKTIIKNGAVIGSNSAIIEGITIGQNARIDASSLVTQNVPQNAIASGSPAFISGYVSNISLKKIDNFVIPENIDTNVLDTAIEGVNVYILPFIADMRGNLSFAEYGQLLPFIPKRYFIVFDVTSKKLRGEHAHRTLQQFLVCVKGSCSVVVDDGSNRQEIILDKPNIGLYLPPMIWGIQYKYSADSVLLVLASDVYDPNDYIREYDQYLKEINTNGNTIP